MELIRTILNMVNHCLTDTHYHLLFAMVVLILEYTLALLGLCVTIHISLLDVIFRL